ncbi:MAG: formimidoylglutamase [Bacteroidia bacterium]
MDISVFFKPIDIDWQENLVDEDDTYMGNVIRQYSDTFPSLEEVKIAIIGVPEDRGSKINKGSVEAPDIIRKKLYRLKQGNFKLTIVDLGNINPGATLQDTYAALAGILVDLIKAGIMPVILGGSQDLAFAQYSAYQKLEQTVNIVNIDSHFDLGTTIDEINSNTYLGKIILNKPNYLFNYSNIGYQSYFVGHEAVEFMNKLYFDVYRLGQVRANIEETEPIVRNADIVLFDIASVRQADAPGNRNSSPNGFSGEEICQIIRYAGISDKLSSIGFYEINPRFDINDQTSHLVAQAIWYFLEGFYHRKKDQPGGNKKHFLRYRVNVKNTDHEIVFYKSKKSDRWWMEVPCQDHQTRYQRHNLVPCSYQDYLTALNEELPERWWQAFQKLN